MTRYLSPRESATLVIVITVAATVFGIDLFTELGVVCAIGYVAVMWFSYRSEIPWAIPTTAIACTGLTVTGALASPLGGDPWKVAINRALSIGAIWLMAELGVRIKQYHQTLARQAASAAEFAAIVHASDDAIVGATLDGVITSWNPGAARLYGYAPVEIIGRPLAVLVPDDRPGEVPRILRQLRAGKSIDHHSTSGLRKDRRLIDVSLTISPIRDSTGNVIGAAAIARDCTERLRLERRLRATVETALDAIIVMNSAGVIVDWNPQAEKTFGWTSDQAVGQDLAGLIMPKQYRAAHLRGLHHFLTTGDGPAVNRRLELSALRAGGEEFPVELSISPTLTPEGWEFNGFLRDITDRKRLEEERRSLQEDLEQRVVERTEALGEANRALEQSNVELQQFAYVASHDLQTPLRGIAGFAQFLQEDYGDKLDERAEEYINRIVQGVTRMQRLIKDLLAYSRVESRATSLGSVDLNVAFEDAKALLDASIADRGALVTRDELPTVSGDGTQLAQLLQNLIGNGIKYCSEEPPRVHVSAERVGSGWRIAVRDNGIGINQQHHARIFEIFRRLHSHHEYPGTGIGLAVCRRIVLRHGGDIWVESKAGEGSCFYFTVSAKGNVEEAESDRVLEAVAGGA